MLDSLRWIAISYLTRPLVLIVLAVAAIAYGIGIYSEYFPSNYQPAYSQFPSERIAVWSRKELDAVRAAGKQQEVRDLNLNQLVSEQAFDDGPRNVFAEFPHVRVLTMSFGLIGGPGNVPEDQIDELPELEYLSLYGDADFAKLHGLKNLRELDLYTLPLTRNEFAQLATLPKLTMIVWHTPRISDSEIAALANLPQLQTLVIDYFEPPKQFRSNITQQTFAPLADAPALKLLYVGSRDLPVARKLTSLARAVLRGKTVLATYQFSWYLFLSLPFLLISGVIGVQLLQQFSTPMRRLAPRFATYHAGFAIALLLALFAIATITIAQVANDAVATAAACAAIVAMGNACPLFAGPAKTQPWALRATNQFMGVIAVGIWFVVMPGSSSWVYNERNPWIAAGLGLIAFVAAAYTVFVLSIAFRLSGAAHLVAQGTARRNRADLWDAMNFRGSWLISAKGRERQITRWPREKRAWTWWQRVRRWQIGNPPTMPAWFYCIPIFLLVGFVALRTIQVGQAAFRGREFQPITIRVMAINFGFILAFLPAARTAAVWRSRMSLLHRELLYPMPRHALQNEWIAAFLFNLLPGSLAAAILVGIGLNIDAFGHIAWLAAACTFFDGFWISLVAGAALGSLAVVIRLGWLAVLLVITTAPVVIILMAVAYGPLAISHFGEAVEIITLASATLLSFTTFRWFTMEAR